jgi:RNA polymerase sigma-70 factor, ECF subfamily
MINKPDKELMILVAEKNSLAFKTLYHRYHEVIYNFIRRYTGNREVAQDLLQETFTRIWFAAHTFDLQKGNFKGWLYKIALNITRNEMSKKRYDYFYHDVTDFTNKDSQALTAKSRPDVEFEIKDAVIYALNKLKPFLKEIILLKHYHQLKFKEISEITNTPVGTLKARFHRAISQMKEMLEPMNID